MLLDRVQWKFFNELFAIKGENNKTFFSFASDGDWWSNYPNYAVLSGWDLTEMLARQNEGESQKTADPPLILKTWLSLLMLHSPSSRAEFLLRLSGWQHPPTFLRLWVSEGNAAAFRPRSRRIVITPMENNDIPIILSCTNQLMSAWQHDKRMWFTW